MRKLITTTLAAVVLGLSSLSAPSAAPVPGFETLYAATFTACSPANGVPPVLAACEAAINALSAAMIAAGVASAVALQSFKELRADVAAAGGLAEIDALFELLLPGSGSLGEQASPV